MGPCTFKFVESHNQFLQESECTVEVYTFGYDDVPEELTAQLGADRLTLTVRGGLDDLTVWLKKHASVSALLSSHESAPFTTATIQIDDDSRETFLKDLSGAFGLRSVHTPDDDLEETFIGLTKIPTEAS